MTSTWYFPPWIVALVLLCLASSAVIPTNESLTGHAYEVLPRQDPPPIRRINQPPPKGKILAWVAFGDSFSAGPGAGAPYENDNTDCLRREGAYAPQLERSNLFLDGYANPNLNFLSCSGHITTTVRDIQIPSIATTLSFMGIVTLSIGGNDIGFGKIVSPCIFTQIGSCSEAINDARIKLYGGELYNNYFAMMNLMIEKLNWCPPAGRTRVEDCFTIVYQTSYPSFFESHTTQCDNVRFFPGFGPKITQALRSELNQLGQEVNTMIAYYIANINRQQFETRDTSSAFMVFADQGERYAGHRFCRDGVNEPDRNNAGTWFFNLYSNRDTTTVFGGTDLLGPASDYTAVDPSSCPATADIGDQLTCGISQMVADGLLPGSEQVPAYNETESKTKTFHPNTNGFGSVSDEVQQRLNYVSATTTGRGCPTAQGLNLRIMGIGDELTAGTVNSIAQRGYFTALDKNLGMVVDGCPGNTYSFVGSQGSGAFRHEGYRVSKVAQIQTFVTNSGALSLRPNLILLMAGTFDITQDANPQDTIQALSGFIDYIFQQCPDATILVQHIPPIGFEDFGPIMSEEQTRVIKYNAAISAMVDTRIALHQHISRVHGRTTTYDHGTGDYVYPQQRGYDLIGEAWMESITVVDQRGWIGIPQILSTAAVNLRIMPFGDSITYGTSSTDGNGYRLDLQNILLPSLTAQGKTLQYIGSVRSGSMQDNFNEGHPGYTIDGIGGQGPNSFPERPNVILLMAGTNDIVQGLDLVNAPTRLGNLIDLSLNACPDATVIVASLTPLLDSTREAAVTTYNAAIPDIIAARTNTGKHVLLADMGAVTSSDIDAVDGIHPNDGGYAIMARAWNAAINDAELRGWISEPVPGAAPICSGQWQPVQAIAYGVGSGDGPFAQSWSFSPAIAYGISNTQPYSTPSAGGAFSQVLGSVFPTNGGGFTQNWVETGAIAFGVGTDGNSVFFGDVDGDGRDDYLVVSETGAVRAWRNTGHFPEWDNLGTIAYGVANRSQIRFADVDCDGYVDYLVISDDGTVNAWLNLGPAHWPNWNNHGQLVAAQQSLGYGSNWHFADINGDKCVDYLLVDPGTGAVKALINDHAFGYSYAGEIAYGAGAPGSSIVFADINGDGLSDYLIVDSNTGAVTAFFNLGPANWPAWSAQNLIAYGVPVNGKRILFANLNPTAYFDRKADYLTVDNSTGAVSAWMNHGYGDNNGDGVRFADIDGDGFDDYLWVSQNGAVRAFLNTKSFPAWNDLGTIATGVGARDNIIFADVNCDGRADYLVVDPATGAVNAYWNLGVSAFPRWDGPHNIAYGVGTPGSWVRFGDIDGDGCADYMTLDPNTGAMNAWLNTGNFPDWKQLGLLATGVGQPGVNVRLADMSGKGRVDYVLLQEDGGASVYINAKQVGDGLVPKWGDQPVSLAYGVGAFRENIILADVNGDGKDDYLIVDPRTAAVDAYINHGVGGKYQPGDGVHLADVTGDGFADYLWLDEDGTVHFYQNLGPSNWPAWGDLGVIFSAGGIARERVLFADLNCDGRADYVVLKDDGNFQVYYNPGPGGFPNWVAGPTTSFSNFPWESVRFADMNGDKCDDLLVVGENGGAVTVYLNNGGSSLSFQGPQLIAYGVGARRADLRFADYDGDGKADYLWVDRVLGSVHGWKNLGPSGWPQWTDRGVIAYGTHTNGLAVVFADVNGDHLADYLTIDPISAAVVASINLCR